MSVVIRGMKMPETCDKCDFCIWSNYHQTAWCRREQRQCFDDYAVEYREKRAEFCPMSELPAEHGRLIDGDIAEVITYTNESGDFADGILYAADWIAQQPTVIEAENPFYESLKRGLEQALNGEVREITVTDVGVSDDA